MIIENQKITLEEAILNYLYWKSSYALVAADRYKVRLDHFKRFVGAKETIDKITGITVIKYHKQMELVEGYSRATVAYSARILKNLFEFLKGREVQCLNPKEIRPMRYIAPDKDIVTEEIFEKMNAVLFEQVNHDLIKKLIIHMLHDTGMRVSELCDLNISDIESTESGGMRCASVRRRKSLRYNTVVWGKETNRLLNLYLGLRLCIEEGNTEALFVTRPTGKRLTTRTVQRWMEQICLLAEIEEEITPHSFRHGKAHQVLNQSGNVRDVQAILGHVNPESSFNYLSLNKKSQIAVSEKYLAA